MSALLVCRRPGGDETAPVGVAALEGVRAVGRDAERERARGERPTVGQANHRREWVGGW